MNKEIWKEIENDYIFAREWLYFDTNRKITNHEFMFHILRAYLNAEKQEEKDNELYAKILFALWEWYNPIFANWFSKYRDFLKPAYEHFLLCDNDSVEKRRCMREYERKTYEYNNYLCYSLDTKKENKCIDGFEKLSGFQFPDAQIIGISMDVKSKENFRLTFEFHDIQVTLAFETVYEFYMAFDDMQSYILDDASCFHYSPNLVGDDAVYTFNVGICEIICKKIKVVDVIKITD